MAVEVKLPTGIEQFVTEDGRLTPTGIILLQQYFRALVDHEKRIVVLEP